MIIFILAYRLIAKVMRFLLSSLMNTLFTGDGAITSP